MADRYVVLHHGTNWDVVDLGPTRHDQPAKLMATAVDDTTAATLAEALNAAHRDDPTALDQLEAIIMELDEVLLALHDNDDPADAELVDDVLQSCRARQEARA